MTFKWDRYHVDNVDEPDICEADDGAYVLAEDAINREAVNAAEIATLKVQLKGAREAFLNQSARLIKANGIIDEVHSWVVCAPICSSDDFMQNVDRIIEITEPK
jgi:hypothetical protein